ncbi:MAG: hypothetical protein CMC38_07465 [Flavobacteriaceae bacterium]|nr:hypothetical protein [Flavobacteriaceae bacterium]|tara:strand:+ start:3190 stop:3690 length:501 start_codon:yes stop_codon:yes gene_type:complete
MKKILLIALVCIFISCSQGNHPDYAANVETVKTQLALQGSEADLQAQLDLAHDDIQWQPAFYGSSPIGKEEYGTYLKGWQDAMEDVVYTPTNFLPGVSPETGLPDGSVRSYGKWTGVNSATGKSWELPSTYHTWDFKDGLIISGGDYFDAGGFLASLQEDSEDTEE